MPERLSPEVSGPVDPVPTVLIVDDRRENLLALDAVLEPLGVRVVHAASGAEALGRCAECEFAVVVLDVMMPGADGLETARALKARSGSQLTPIIFLTAAESDRRRVHEGYASGAVDYLFKPVDPDVLRAKVAAFVDLYRHRRAEHWRQRRRYADQAAAAAAAAHRDGDQRFRLLAESVPATVWTATADGRIDTLNGFGARYVGASIERGNDIQWTDYVHPDDVLSTRRQWALAVRAAEPFEAEVRIWSADLGAWRRHIARAVPRTSPTGDVLGWVGVNTDIEESKRAEEEEHALLLTAEREARIASDDARVELGHALDRIARLQALTAALSEAATPSEVAEAVAHNGVGALRASAAVVATLDRQPQADGAMVLRPVAWAGYPAPVMEKWKEIPLDADIPLALAARTGQPVAIGDRAQRVRDFPALKNVDALFSSAYALPLVANGTLVGVMGLSFARQLALNDEDRALAEAIGRQCAQALQRAGLFAAERRALRDAETARKRVEFLSEAGAVLNASLDYQETLQALVDVAVPYLGDYAVVDMLGSDGALQRLALAHRDPVMRAQLAEAGTTIRIAADLSHPAQRVLVEGAATVFPVLTQADLAVLAREGETLAILSRTGATSLMVVPLRARSRTLGMLILGRNTPDASYTDADLQLAEDLARRAGVAIDTARLYEEAQEANRAKASFLAAISHDLRQPLNASLGFLDIALMGIRGHVGDELREDLERVRRNQQHLLALINDVLSFARVEAGQLVVRREIVPLQDVFEALPSLVSPQAAAKGVTLAIDPCPPTHCVLGDPDRVTQVFTNLLTNAIKATPPGGTVMLECELGGDVVLARVRDTGIGIPPAMRDHIFEPFVQVSRSLSRPEDGIGLGLSISRNLVRAMGGELTVESTVGTGSVFTVSLPIATSATSATSAFSLLPVSG